MRQFFWLTLSVFVFLYGTLCARAAVDIKGIDISHWQGTINWSSVKNAGYKFAFMKATQGNTYVDPTFATNLANATAQGIRVGPYHFCDLNTDTSNPQDPVNEANHFLAIIKPKYQSGMYLPPVADVEGFPSFSSTAEAQSFTSAWVTSFSNTIYDSLGVRPIIYTSLSKANSYYNRRVESAHELWLAWWKGTGTSSPPVASDTPGWGIWEFWQYADNTSVPGISGNVDGDVYYGTQAQLDALRIGNDGAMPGDFNRDGTVDARDYILWRNTNGQTVPIYSGADANGDAKVNDTDFAVWRSHFNTSSSVGSGTASLAERMVPEPVTIGLATLGICLWLLTTGRTSRRRSLDLAL